MECYNAVAQLKKILGIKLFFESKNNKKNFQYYSILYRLKVKIKK